MFLNKTSVKKLNNIMASFIEAQEKLKEYISAIGDETLKKKVKIEDIKQEINIAKQNEDVAFKYLKGIESILEGNK